MADADDFPRREKLPVTAEVGDEGGSYADATVQAETFTDNNPPVDKRIQPSSPPDVRTDETSPEPPAEGMRKYPAE
jgi:hypothetical protein